MVSSRYFGQYYLEMEGDAPQGLDYALIGRNVKRSRINQGLSQTELAIRGGVDLASVYRVERGTRTRRQTLKKIAAGLRILFEDLLIEKTFTGGESSFAINRTSNAKWFPVQDKRLRAPADQIDRCQDPVERQRLGGLGLVPWFICPPTVIPKNGPGMVLLEIFDERLEPLNAEFYEDAALYVLDGEASVSIGQETVNLEKGDWIAYQAKDLGRIAVVPPCEVATLLWVGANRVKKAQ